MSTILSNAIITGLLFIFSVASGIWLHRLGKPLNLLISNLHKLISLATMLLAGVVVFKFAKIAAMSAPAVVAIIASGLLAVALLATGGLLSSGKLLNTAILTIHRIAVALAVISSVMVVYLL